MLKTITSSLLFLLLFIEGIYLKILLSRTDYGSHATNLGCDTVFIMYGLCLATLSIATVLFFKTQPKSYIYLFYLVLSSSMLIAFFIMDINETIDGIGNGAGGLIDFFCPSL